MRAGLLAASAMLLLAACARSADDERTYAIGAALDSAQLAAWDSDVGAEGAELPAGRGTVAEGSALYAEQCASCHGANGQGMEPAYPPLVGRPAEGESFDFANQPKVPRTIGNYWPHATTLFDYLKRAMPHLTPGSLSDDQVYALTAYLLAANGVIADTTTLDADGLRKVQMPARDRFVADDRVTAERY